MIPSQFVHRRLFSALQCDVTLMIHAQERGTDVDRVFIYWDNSNLFHEAQRLAAERSEGPNAQYRVRVHFDNMLRLAHADRPIERALAVGSVPQEMRQLWNRMESTGIEVHLFDRGSRDRGNRKCPTISCNCRCSKMP